MGKLRLVEPKSEVMLLKTICEADTTAMLVFAALKDDHFGYPAAKYVFRYIKEYFADTQSIPTWENVCGDMKGNREVRRVVSKFKQAPQHRTRKAAMKGVDIVIGYQRARALVEIVNVASERLEGDSVDIEEVYQEIGTMLTQATLKKDTIPKFSIGVGNNTTGLVKDILDYKMPPAIPTGIKAWDDRNKGIFRGTVFTLAATSGAGKSALAHHMALQMASGGSKVSYVSLEMSEHEMFMRTISNISKTPLSDIVGNRLTQKGKDRAERAYKDYAKKLKKANASYNLYVPQEDVTGEELLMVLQPSKYDVIIIDYLSLLKGTDGDNQWKVLGALARYSKRYAEANNCVIVLLAQLSEDTGRIRYARAVREHSGVMWTWNYEPENREERILDIIPQKARNQDMRPFKLRENYEYMRVEEYSEDAEDDQASYAELDAELEGLDEELL